MSFMLNDKARYPSKILNAKSDTYYSSTQTKPFLSSIKWNFKNTSDFKAKPYLIVRDRDISKSFSDPVNWYLRKESTGFNDADKSKKSSWSKLHFFFYW